MKEKIPTQELFDLLKSRLIIELKNNEELCPECHGLKINYKESNGKSYVQTCARCYVGKVYRCEFCGTLNRQDFCNCKEASNKRAEAFTKKEHEKFQEAFKTAKIIKLKDYDGYLTSLYNEERVVEADEFAEQYADEFDVEDSPKYVCASVGEVHFNLDIKDVISDKTEGGYDDMYEHLNTDSKLLSDAQVLIDKWMEENESNLKVYSETNKIIVDLTDLYEECKNKM